VSEVCPIPEEVPSEVRGLQPWLRQVIIQSRFFPLFAALVFLLFFVLPVVGSRGNTSFLLNLFVITTFVVSLRAIANNRRMMWVIMLLAVPMFVARIWAQATMDPVALMAYAGLNALFLLAVLLVCLSRVVDRSPVNEDKILGAICVYLLIGVVFSFVYQIHYMIDPQAIDLGEQFRDADTSQQFWVFNYYSFVTLTTLGYGDVLPVAPFARSMATLEAVIGPLYLAILIARLVSLADVPSPGRPRRPAAGRTPDP
jgi:hypothetical protein